MGMNNTRSGRRWRVRALLAPVLLMSGLTIGSAGSAHAGHVDIQHGNLVVCGGVLDNDGETYTLTHDLGPCPNGGLTIAADRITLDLNGYKIFGCSGITEDPATHVPAECATVLVNGDGIGVKFLGVKDATVRNGTIQHFDTGVFIDRLVDTHALGVAVSYRESKANVVEDLTIDSNIGNDGSQLLDIGEGIAITGDDNIVRRNIVTNNGPFGGIRVLTPAGNNTGTPSTSNRNIIGGNCSSGSLDGNTVDNNDVDYNSAGVENGIGIGMEPRTNETKVCNNTVTDSGLDGITVFANSRTNIIKYNTVARNGMGNASASSRHGDGIRLFTSTPIASNPTIDADNTVSNNYICGSAASGLRVDSYGNTISSNTSGTGTTPAGNTCTDNHQDPSPTPPLPAVPPATPYDLHDTIALASNSSSTVCGPASPALNNNWTANSAPSIGSDPSAYNNACTIKP